MPGPWDKGFLGLGILHLPHFTRYFKPLNPCSLGRQIWIYHLYETLLASQDALLAHWAGQPQVRPQGAALADTH